MHIEVYAEVFFFLFFTLLVTGLLSYRFVGFIEQTPSSQSGIGYTYDLLPDWRSGCSVSIASKTVELTDIMLHQQFSCLSHVAAVAVLLSREYLSSQAWAHSIISGHLPTHNKPIRHVNIGIIFLYVGNPNNGSITLSYPIGCSTLSQKYCKLIR